MSLITSPVGQSEAEIWVPSSNEHAGLCDALATSFSKPHYDIYEASMFFKLDFQAITKKIKWLI